MKKKILIINEFVFAGGIESVMQNFAEYLCNEGYDITIFTPFREKKFHNVYQKKIKHKYYYRYRFKNHNLLTRIVYKLTRASKGTMFLRKYDAVIAIKEGAFSKLALKFKNAKKKNVWIHSDFETLHYTKNNFKSDEEERELYSKFDHTVCVTKAVERNLIKTIGNPGNTIVKYNPVNNANIIEMSKVPCDSKRTEGKKLFVTIGRISHEKGYAELVESISEMSERNFELWIIGGGDKKRCEDDAYFQRVKKTIEDNDLSSVAKMLGRKDNPYPYLKQADCYICSSFSESFCMSIQEALVLGVPVITTNCPGAVEVLNSDVSVVVDKIQDIPEVMCDIIENKYTFDMSKYKYPSLEERMKAIEEIL